MGCSASKLEDEEAVQLCKDRKNFVKQVIENRSRFASGHVAYIQSMKRVSFALMHSVAAADLHEFLSDSYNTPPFTPVHGLSPEIRSIPLKSFASMPDNLAKDTIRSINYLRSDGSQAVTLQEWPEPDGTIQIESYCPMENYTTDGFFTSPYNRSIQQSPSPQSPQWDYFWNPFCSLDSYGYTPRGSFHRIENEEDIAGLRQVREAEGIPELEDVNDDDIEDDYNDHDDDDRNRRGATYWKSEAKNKRPEAECKHAGVQVGGPSPVHTNGGTQKVQEIKEFKSKGPQNIEASKRLNEVELDASNKDVAEKIVSSEETPGFTVYVNRRPASMAEVMKDMENQFIRICDCANEISAMLEASRAQCSPANNKAGRKVKPVALFWTSSRPSSFLRFFKASPDSKGEADESSSVYSDECCMVSGSHKSTLDRLYAWEKKLYEEVKTVERIQTAYERKCVQLRNHDINGDEPSVVDKTRVAIRDLHTRLKVSIHTVESISRRIEVLRDRELHPQLMEMIQGLSRMWKTMADCHRIQKRIIDEAKLLLFSRGAASTSFGQMSPNADSNLAAELRNWRCSFANWFDAQRSYARALAGWALRCTPANTGKDTSSGKAPSTLPQLRTYDEVSSVAPEVVRLCARWSQLVESMNEKPTVDGMDFFAAGIASVSAPQREAVEGEAAAATAAARDVGPRVLCAGLSVAVGSLAELAMVSSEGYNSLVRSCAAGEERTMAENA